MAFDLGAITAKIDADITGFKNNLNKAKDETIGMSQTMSKLGDTIKTALVIGAGAAAGGLVLLSKSALEAAANFEQTQISFEVMLGSAEKATKLLSELQTFAKKTPFNLTDLQDATKRLLAYGVEGNKVIETMSTLGNITSAVGRDKMPQLILAFGQVKAAGRLMGTELRQFTETGVPLLQVLADQFGVTTGRIQEMVSEGEIGFSDVQKALESLGGEGGKWGDMMDKQSKTLSGSISNLQDSWTQLLVVLGTVFIPIATQVVQTLTAFLTPIMEVMNGTKSLGEAFGLSSEQTAFFSVVLAEFVSFLTETLVPAVQAVVGYLSAFWNAHKTEFMNAWNIIWGIIQVVWALIYGLIKTGLELLAGDWTGAWNAVKQATSMAWNGIQSILNGALGFLSGWGGAIVSRLTQPFRDAWSTIEGLMNKIKDALDFTKRHSPSVLDIVESGVSKVNRALEGLRTDIILTPETAAMTVSNGGQSTKMLAVNIDLAGAFISDTYGAQRMAEIMGDQIIKKVQNQLRI